jgi:hypothetical protein
MIYVNSVAYQSRYAPADKLFFQTLERTELLLKGDKDIDEHMHDWSCRWDLKERLQEAQDVLKDHPELKKELKTIIISCEYELLRYSDDIDEQAAYHELEIFLSYKEISYDREATEN